MENERIKEIEEQINQLKAAWPAHSVSPSMWQRLEELEEELQRLGEDKNTDAW
ncbi:histidine kinase [Chloroflexota bacterium]